MLTPKFDELVQQLRVLPGVGPKSAARMAMHLLDRKRGAGLQLAAALEVAMRDIKSCQKCRSYADTDICHICNDPRRDDTKLCVVESVADVVAIENSGGYRGRYFVLGGRLSPLDGIGADDIGVPLLMTRIADEQIVELILATNATVEGQTTAHYLQESCNQLAGKHAEFTVTRLAQGVPLGGELEYIDSMTLHQALRDRN